MEKEKEDAFSPTGVLEDYLNSLESDSVSTKESTSDFEDQQFSKPPSRWAGFVQLLKTKSKRHLGTLHPLNLSKRFSSSMREIASPRADSDLNYFKPHWKNFTLSQLQSATNNFSHDKLIGKGGYAEVYKGCLRNGQLIAVKKLMKGSTEERIGDFLAEVGIMAHVNHPNTAKLIGYGVEGGVYLVLELSAHGSLASLLHGSNTRLEWRIRYKIAKGTAEGLVYLHEGGQRRIIHRDIKAANILLTKDFEPQICDFGLAKWLPEHWTHHTVSSFEGTFGYLAPEFLMHGIIDEKTDVFAFGVLLLELISGRRALDYSQKSLVMWAKPLLKKNNIRELVDPSLLDDYNSLQMNLMVLSAFLCVQQSSIRRPRMNQVLQILKGDHSSLEMVKRCRKSTSWRSYYQELFDAEDHHLNRV
ncbi:receptor-like cytosolic serine/threonine-protein kinase RBK2 [Heracleum sosnowskyi]|uniref:non-specific serine/threonine protein kinase n=1 Tax=Heracleum sosnowskyi TaxID=360622 RepID=A0AAD8GYE6_9APIA|nr:receptor-like cytosolic serine/threonine-protein kinase RBK2 [Heracleum sosnowskyi]